MKASWGTHTKQRGTNNLLTEGEKLALYGLAVGVPQLTVGYFAGNYKVAVAGMGTVIDSSIIGF